MPDLKTSILIVGDEESVRSSLAKVLSVHGHSVPSASDGTECQSSISATLSTCSTVREPSNSGSSNRVSY